MMLTTESLKRYAKRLKRILAARGHDVSHTKCLEAFAAGKGFPTYAAMIARGGPFATDHNEVDAADRLVSLIDPPPERDGIISAIREALNHRSAQEGAAA